jgi:hypothetical protein
MRNNRTTENNDDTQTFTILQLYELYHASIKYLDSILDTLESCKCFIFLLINYIVYIDQYAFNTFVQLINCFL